MGLTALGVMGAREGGGDPRGRIALMTAAFSAGQIVGPSFAGYFYDLTGSLSGPSWAAAAALVVAGFLTSRGRAAHSCWRVMTPSERDARDLE